MIVVEVVLRYYSITDQLGRIFN